MVYVWRIIPVPNANANLVPVTSFRAHTKYITRCLLSPDTKQAYFLFPSVIY